MTPSKSDPLREQLARFLNWEEAHVGFDRAIDGVHDSARGARAVGFEHSIWQLLEHLRLAQRDLLEFCRNPKYRHTLKWPDDYWPANPAPPDGQAWDASIDEFKADRAALATLVRDPSVDLFALVPTGTGRQTYLRGILLVADHAAYHVGQIVAVRRALGCWS